MIFFPTVFPTIYQARNGTKLTHINNIHVLMGYLKIEVKSCEEIIVTKLKTNMETINQFFWNIPCPFVNS
jgi:hypothetical protein